MKLLRPDGTVKKSFPQATSVQYIGRTARIWGTQANMPAVLEELALEDGESIQQD